MNKCVNQHQIKIDSLCLNPICQEERLCRNEQYPNHNLELANPHYLCGQWVKDLSFLNTQPIGDAQIVFEELLTFDYYQDPIGSIYLMEQYVAGDWETSLKGFFYEAQQAIMKQLSETFQKCHKGIAAHMTENRRIFNKILSFCNNVKVGSSQITRIFKDKLASDLLNIQQTGKMLFSQRQSLSGKVDDILREIRSLQNILWNKQSKSELKIRMEASKQWQQLYSFASNASPLNANLKIQQIQSLFRTSIVSSQGKDTYVSCIFCPRMANANQMSKNNLWKCKMDILQHMCTMHTDEIFLKMPVSNPLKLSLQEFCADIIAKRVKRVAILDKQNLSWNSLQQNPEVYYAQVLSQNSEHLAKRRYLKAESKGRDAADILVVMMLYQLSRLKVKEVELYTKDHYGETIVPIMAELCLKVILHQKPPLPPEF